jgi:hypothetical protein
MVFRQYGEHGRDDGSFRFSAAFRLGGVRITLMLPYAHPEVCRSVRTDGAPARLRRGPHRRPDIFDRRRYPICG